MYLASKAFWLGTGERVVKTLAQTLIVLWGADQFNLLAVGWQTSLGVAAGAGVLSLLTSIASGAPIAPGESGSPSLVKQR